MSVVENRYGEHAIGALWESEFGWSIRVNQEVGATDSRFIPCPHCQGPFKRAHQRHSEQYWICPRVIVAWNEGGYDTTGVCADCVKAVLNGEAVA